MKKIIMSAIMCVALMASSVAVAQDTAPKKDQPKKECCQDKAADKKDEKKSCCKDKAKATDKKDSKKATCCKDKAKAADKK
ncbi:hypothetical protein [Dysgonomonas sp.]|nr:hypothetical protein [Prevotella sp.]